MAFSGSVIVHTAVPVVTLNYTINDDGSASFSLTRDTNAYGKFGGTFVVTVKDSNGKTGSITKANNSTQNYSGNITGTVPAGTFSTTGTVSYTVSSTCTACTSESSINYVTNRSMGSHTWTNCYVRVNGVYKPGVMYVRVNGVYKVGVPYVRVSGTYKQGK